MAMFQIKTKNQVDVEKKPRVYFTCHPDDVAAHFDTVCEWLFATHDCAVYYTEDMTEPIAEEDKEADLGRSNLLVIPVTYSLLTRPCRAMDDFRFAVDNHIPVLPLMMEEGLDVLYSRADKFGELQYLKPDSDDTEIAFEEN